MASGFMSHPVFMSLGDIDRSWRRDWTVGCPRSRWTFGRPEAGWALSATTAPDGASTTPAPFGAGLKTTTHPSRKVTFGLNTSTTYTYYHTRSSNSSSKLGGKRNNCVEEKPRSGCRRSPRQAQIPTSATLSFRLASAVCFWYLFVCLLAYRGSFEAKIRVAEESGERRGRPLCQFPIAN